MKFLSIHHSCVLPLVFDKRTLCRIMLSGIVEFVSLVRSEIGILLKIITMFKLILMKPTIDVGKSVGIIRSI